MPARLALVLVGTLVLSVPAAAPAKGFTRVVLVASDGRWFEARGSEPTIDGLLSRRGSVVPLSGGYLRLFFVGPGEFPANPARYYPVQRCVALDWPRYETTCRRVSPKHVRLLGRAGSLPRFHRRPTVLTRVTYLGQGSFAAVAALKSPVELALGRDSRAASQPQGCYPFAGAWRGPASARRPVRFHLCADGVHADRHRYPLGRGVWEWLRLNVGPPVP